MKSKKVQKKISQIFAIFRYTLSSTKNMSAFFLETGISENVSDLKGRRCILTL